MASLRAIRNQLALQSGMQQANEDHRRFGELKAALKDAVDVDSWRRAVVPATLAASVATLQARVEDLLASPSWRPAAYVIRPGKRERDVIRFWDDLTAKNTALAAMIDSAMTSASGTANWREELHWFAVQQGVRYAIKLLGRLPSSAVTPANLTSIANQTVWKIRYGDARLFALWVVEGGITP